MRTCRLLLALIVSALISSGASGQGTVLQSGPWTPNHVPVYAQGGTSQPMIFDSGPAAGGALGTGVSELNITQQGTPSSVYGTPFCIDDEPANNPSGFHQFCLGADSLGGGLLSYNAYGGASPQPLNLILNGTEYTFPFTAGGAIQGPTTTVINDIVTWNNTAGTLVKDSAVPISTVALLTGATFTGPVVVPSLDDIGNPTISTSPTGNPTGGSLLPTFSSLAAQGTTIQSSNREFLANFGLVSSTGAGVANNNGDKVTIYCGMVANAGTGDVWCMNPLVQQSAGSGSYNAQIIEADLNNFNTDRGGSDGPSGYPTKIAVGLSVTGINDTNNFQNTAGVAIDSFGANSGSSLFAHGIAFNGFFKFNEFAEYAQAPTVFALFGGHTYGLDCNASILSGGCVRLAGNPNGGIIGRNAANNADANVLRFDGTNSFLCETSCSGLFVNAPIEPSQNNVYALGGPSSQWATAYIGVVNAATNVFVNGTQVATASGIAGECAQFISAQEIVATGSACGSGGGGGGGGVNAGSAGEVAWYASTGSTVSGSTFLNIVGGALGVNTVNPTSTLTVNGTAAISGNTSIAGAFQSGGSVQFSALPNGCLQTNSSGVVASTGAPCGSGGGGGGVNAGTAGQLAFYNTTGSTVSGSTFLFVGGGAFGVNTTSPSSTLTVNGTAAVSGNTSIAGAFQAGGSVQLSSIVSGCLTASSTGVVTSTGSACGGGSGAVTSVTAGGSGNILVSPTTGAVQVDLVASPHVTSLGVGTSSISSTLTVNGSLGVSGAASFGSATAMSGSVQMTGLTTGTPVNMLCQDTSSLEVSCGATFARTIPNIFATELTIDTGTNTATISDGGSLAVAGSSNLGALTVNGAAAFGSAVLFSGSVQMTGLSSGTPTKFLCVTSTNVVIASTTAC